MDLRPSFPPPIFACEQDMSPSEWRDVRQEVWRAIQTGPLPSCDGDPELLGIPIYDDGSQQVQTSDTEVLAFGGAVADFALSPDPQCTF